MLNPGFTPNFFLGFTGPRGGGIILSPILSVHSAPDTARQRVWGAAWSSLQTLVRPHLIYEIYQIYLQDFVRASWYVAKVLERVRRRGYKARHRQVLVVFAHMMGEEDDLDSFLLGDER